MTLRETILKWNNSWHYDFWWRQKYSVSFNSSQHRDVNQIDIKIEYLEFKMAEQAYLDARKNGEDAEEMKKTGQWIKERTNISQDVFEKIDISQF